MKAFSVVVFAVFALVLSVGAFAEENNTRRLSDSEIDAQLRNMQDMLPVEIRSGIRWVEIKRSGQNIQYTYIVNANSAEWDDDERLMMMARLQDFGCRQLLPAMCEGSQVMFASGLSATTTYHDSFGNYLFDCNFTKEICRPPENAAQQ